MRWATFTTLLADFAALSKAIEPVEIKGNKFFHEDGTRYFMKGVSYQLSPEDPLIDTEQCQRDIELMKDLGTNALRVYHVDATANHDGCMKAFADAGIYLLIDLDTFDTYITPTNQCWSKRQYDRFAEVMDAFEQYNNLLAFFLGNENIAAKEDSTGAPFIKAAARDMKAYRDAEGYRKIPIGYSAADIKELRPMLQDYLTCGGNSSETVEFFALNSYSWCDPSDYERSTYNQLQEYAEDFPVPIFFTETGCNVPGPRLWEDQDAIFGDKMIRDWSGAIIYEWIQEQNNYGIITYGESVGGPSKNDETVFDNWTRKGTPTPISPDFDNLKTKWASIQPTGVRRDAYDPSHVSTRACPTSTPDGWWVIPGDVKLPALDETVADFEPLHKKTTPDPTHIMTPPPSSIPTEVASDGPSHSKDETSPKDVDEEKEERQGADSSALATKASLVAIVLGAVILL